MPAAPAPAAPTNPPAEDGRANTSRLLTLVRALIDYGRQLAATLQQRTAATDLIEIVLPFGTLDIARILACITRGLLRAAALEARLTARLDRPPAAAARSAAAPRSPRATRPVDPTASATEPGIARLPTPADIAAEVRRRPIGAVIADICRDLGIAPRDPLWREISFAIMGNHGNLTRLFKDVLRRLDVWVLNPPTLEHPDGQPPHLPFALAPATGPP